MDLAQRIDLAERVAEAKGVDVSTHTAAIRRRLDAMEKRLYGDRVAAKIEQLSESRNDVAGPVVSASAFAPEGRCHGRGSAAPNLRVTPSATGAFLVSAGSACYVVRNGRRKQPGA